MKQLFSTLLLLLPFGLLSQTNVIEPELHCDILFQGRTGAFDIIEKNGKVFTVCDRLNDINELWVFDEKFNSMVKLYENKTISTHIEILSSEFNDIILFSVYEGFIGELWVTDGTVLGTNKLTDLAIKNYETIMYKGYLYFSASLDFSPHVDLWRTDGTLEGTTKVKHVKEKWRGTAFDFHILNDKLIYTFAESYSDRESELWVTDGTEDGTKKLASMAMAGRLMTEVVGDKLIFTNTPFPLFDSELWVTDGTQDGTFRLDNLLGLTNLNINSYDIFENRIYLSISSELYGTEPWVSDGTLEGTYMLKDLNVNGSSNPIFYPFDANQKEELMFLAVEEGPNYSIMMTDGTMEGTYPITEGDDLFKINEHHYSLSEDKYYFLNSNYELGNELWVSDFTVEGTHLVKDITVGKKSSIIEFARVNFNGRTIFSNRDENNMYSIWITDGTEEKTVILNNELNDLPEEIGKGKIINEFAYFTENSKNDSKSRLWQTDMTQSGTSLIQPLDAINKEQINDINSLFAFKNHIYFFADYYGEGQQLYRIPNTISSVEEEEQQTLLTLYPNPAEDYIQIEIVKPMQLSIISSTGAVVKDCGIVSDGKIEVSKLSTGVYFIVDEQGNNIAKFVKE